MFRFLCFKMDSVEILIKIVPKELNLGKKRRKKKKSSLHAFNFYFLFFSFVYDKPKQFGIKKFYF